jgi:N-sulfoglucosamine sulfohydrolase
VTADPVVSFEHGRAVAGCPTPGASIAWTSDPPPAESTTAEATEQEWVAKLVSGPPHSDLEWVMRLVGGPDTEGRRWRPYGEPLAPPPDASELWFRAQRLGFRASGDVSVVCA